MGIFMGKIKTHFLVGLVFICLGIISVIIQKINTDIEIIALFANAFGTLSWAVVFTVIFSLIFSRLEKWKYITLIFSLIFCLGIEFLQLTNFSAAATKRYPALHYLLGASFDITDLPWYVVGIFIPWQILAKNDRGIK